MSFRTNTCQQISLNDKLMNLTEREKKALDKSWAKIFADEIFPAIDEERFSVLYSDKASRPNTPVNVIIGALIIKELFDYSDDEIVENLMLDLHLQYALHTTSYEEQPLSDKTLSRFRKRCYDYETLHGVDLYRDCVKDLGGKIAKIMKLNGRIRRMDSMMIESNIRFLSRMELIYTCISIDACFPDSVVGFTPNENTNPFYIKYFIESQKLRLWAFAPATAQKNINLDTLENLIVPYCGRVEQDEVVKEIESRMSVCDGIERTIDLSLQQAEALRQSILKKAFEGDI